MFSVNQSHHNEPANTVHGLPPGVPEQQSVIDQAIEYWQSLRLSRCSRVECAFMRGGADLLLDLNAITLKEHDRLYAYIGIEPL